MKSLKGLKWNTKVGVEFTAPDVILFVYDGSGHMFQWLTISLTLEESTVILLHSFIFCIHNSGPFRSNIVLCIKIVKRSRTEYGIIEIRTLLLVRLGRYLPRLRRVGWVAYTYVSVHNSDPVY